MLESEFILDKIGTQQQAATSGLELEQHHKRIGGPWGV